MRYKKFIKSLPVLLAVILALAGLGAYRYWFGCDLRRQANTMVEDAVLYPGQGNSLQYNVIYSGSAASAVISDETGNEITDLAALRSVLGTADAPDRVFSPETGSRGLGKAVTADLQTDFLGNIRSIRITSIVPRPVIGIAWKTPEIGQELTQIAGILEQNGAFAVYLPMVLEETGAKDVLSQIDGILFPGGEDWNPGLYGEAPAAHGSREWNEFRDLSDLALMKAALEDNVPILAICRGMQGMNIALGGGLIQDIPTYLGQQVSEGQISDHRVSAVLSGSLEGGEGKSCGCEETHLRLQLEGIDHSKEAGHHNFPGDVSSDSVLLSRIFPDNLPANVATAHHQAIDPQRLGVGLTVAAASADGIIEAVEFMPNRFALGLQWHPEKDAILSPRADRIDHDSGNAPIRALILAAGE